MTLCPMPLDLTKPHQSDIFPFYALGNILGAAARATCKQTGCSEGIAGTAFLAAASQAVQGHVDIQLPGFRPTPVSLFCCSFGKSGAGKTLARNLAMKPFNVHEEQLFQAYSDCCGIYNNLRKILDKKSKSHIDILSGLEMEDIFFLAGGVCPSLPPMIEPTLLLSDVTSRGIEGWLERGMGSAALNTDEGAQLLMGNGFAGNSKVHLATRLSSLWDGTTCTESSRTRGLQRFSGHRLSVHLMTQPEFITSLFGPKDVAEQGVLGRFLVSIDDRTSMPQSLSNTENEALIQYEKAMQSLLTLPLPTVIPDSYRLALEEFQRQYANGRPLYFSGKLNPRVIRLSCDAEQLYREYNACIREISGNDNMQHPVLNAFIRRKAQHAARIAAVLAAFEDIECLEVSTDYMNRGIMLVTYYVIQLKQLFDMCWNDTIESAAMELWTWLQQQSQLGNLDEDVVTQRMIQQYGPYKFRHDKTLRVKTIDFLCDGGYLVPHHSSCNEYCRSWHVNQKPDGVAA